MSRTSGDEKPLPFEPAGQFCPSCTCNNLLTATQCEVCGAPLRGRPAAALPEEERIEDAPGNDDDRMNAVPFDEREPLGQFPSDFDADLAAGFLRSLGIAVEIAPAMPYGPPMPTLWVRPADAAEARRLLAETVPTEPSGDGGDS